MSISSVLYITAPMLMAICIAGCAGSTYMQKGIISGEQICYEGECYITIVWEDSSVSNVKKAELPEAKYVYRFCTIKTGSEAGDMNQECSLDVFKTPIKLFQQSKEDAIANLD